MISTFALLAFLASAAPIKKLQDLHTGPLDEIFEHLDLKDALNARASARFLRDAADRVYDPYYHRWAKMDPKCVFGGLALETSLSRDQIVDIIEYFAELKSLIWVQQKILSTRCTQILHLPFASKDTRFIDIFDMGKPPKTPIELALANENEAFLDALKQLNLLPPPSLPFPTIYDRLRW